MVNRRFFIKEWYDSMGIPTRRSIQKAYLEDFNCHLQTFYQHVKDHNPPAERILWFAEKFELTLDDMTYPPGKAIIRPQRPERGQRKFEFQP